MSKINYVSIDRVFARLGRDLKGTEINESDVIEWIGEALEFLEVPQILIEDVKFLDVKNYQVDMPTNLHMITQIAKHNQQHYMAKELSRYTPPPEDTIPFEGYTDVTEEMETLPDNYLEAFLNSELTQTFPLRDLAELDLDWTYTIWTSSAYYKRYFTPVRLKTGTFFNTLVCKEKDESLYASCSDEYTIVGTTDKKIRFNFSDTQIAISYLKNAVEKETGYPLVPDQISYITAIVYYIKWKIAEMHEWAGRDGWSNKVDKAEVKWLKYCRQAKNFMKMPKTLDEYQNLLEQTHNLIPNHKRYYGFFGDLGKNKARNFMNYNKEY